MTAIRSWNGSRWAETKFCTDTWPNNVFKGYKPAVPEVPAVPGPVVANWDFYSDEGWRYYTGAAYDGVPGSTGSELMLGKTGTNDTPWTVSPSLDNYTIDALRYKQLVAQCSIRVEHYAGDLPYGIDIEMKGDFGGPLQEDSVFWEVFGTHGNVVLTGDYPLSVYSWDSPRIYFHSYCSNASANWMLFIDWARFIDTATGQPVTGPGTPAVPAVPAYEPKYWNGSAWASQNEV